MGKLNEKYKLNDESLFHKLLIGKLDKKYLEWLMRIFGEKTKVADVISFLN